VRKIIVPSKLARAILGADEEKAAPESATNGFPFATPAAEHFTIFGS